MFTRLVPALLAAVTAAALAWPAAAQSDADKIILDASAAARRGQRDQLAELRDKALQSRHALAMWPDYWALSARLGDVDAAEVEAFYKRWRGSYVEDRLRNEWLLVLGRRGDWAAFMQDLPRFRMNDDREVTCFALTAKMASGQDAKDAAREAWAAQRGGLNDGCRQLGQSLRVAAALDDAALWSELRQAVDAGRIRSARAVAEMLGPEIAKPAAEAFESAARYLARRSPGPGSSLRNVYVLAVMRLASSDPDTAARHLEQAWAQALPRDWAAAAWATVAKQAALKLEPESVAWFQRSLALRAKAADTSDVSGETWAWAARAALRWAPNEEQRWSLVQNAVDAMPLKDQIDPTWIYWKARAVSARAATGAAGDAARAASRRMLESIASPLDFYGKLALEDLGRGLVLPASPPPLSDAERGVAAAHPGLKRALQLLALGLRSEGVREWNYSLIGMSERELLAAAQLACDREVYDRCITASERTRDQVDLAQRFPTPMREAVIAATRDVGLDPAFVYGLIRQESRFVMDARSRVGASGLMQVMPATAKWTAKRIGLDWRADMISDRDINLKIGTTYLKLVLDDFGGSAAMATAAYNAGPSRSRRWREGPSVEAAAWAESIPFSETRDYVKKVLSNTTLYAALMDATQIPALKARLGAPIGPRETALAAPNLDLP
jgi:soluble lytic murein transglycosylase